MNDMSTSCDYEDWLSLFKYTFVENRGKFNSAEIMYLFMSGCLLAHNARILNSLCSNLLSI
mgnify:CR=1 FL=1